MSSRAARTIGTSGFALHIYHQSDGSVGRGEDRSDATSA
jgi:hypothetical protein